jgi:hypothetical protein
MKQLDLDIDVRLTCPWYPDINANQFLAQCMAVYASKSLLASVSFSDKTH